MVTRKPVGGGAGPTPLSHTAPLSHAAHPSHGALNPPYPASPVTANDGIGEDPDRDRWETRSRSSSVSSHDTWNSGFSEDEGRSPTKDVPAALRIGPRNAAAATTTTATATGTSPNRASELPSSLRPGPPQGVQQPPQPNPWATEELDRTRAPSRTPIYTQQPQAPQAPPPVAPPSSHNPRNPYLRMQHTGQPYGNDSQAAWGAGDASTTPPVPQSGPPPPPPPAPVELPTIRTPTEAMAGMTLDSHLNSHLASKRSTSDLPHGLQPALVPQQTGPPPPISAQHTGTSSNPWDDMDREDRDTSEHTTAPPQPLAATAQGPGLAQSTISYHPEHARQAAEAPPTPQTLPARNTEEPWQAPQEYQPPQATHEYQPPQAPPPPPPPPQSQPAYHSSQPSPQPPQSQPAYQPPRSSPPLISLMDHDPPSATQAAFSEETAPPKPPRPDHINVSAINARPSSSGAPETPMTRAKRQRNETYQIKQVNWFDASAGPSGKMRRTPIMTQNANGPCPLLALVNALTLSTPENVPTSLVDALRSREQVSLGLLLDAVFEELARRSEISDKELPDVADLYSFLITLHTGMNVNPRFVAPGTLHVGSVGAEMAVDQASIRPGVFEETREMVLYSTFDIPLIHGWTPPANSPEYAAFDRSAKTFDDALNIQFREQELEDKLQTIGLNPEEQQTYEDIALIKHYLDTYPTQLTDHGLEVMASSLKPGQIAILFRNDHFSTLYKHPRFGALMTLVTDAGYSSHDEIVWESLVDVSGAANELFSGDFRPVGNTTSSAPQPVSGSNSQIPQNWEDSADGWETVPPRNSRNANTSSETQYAPPPGPPPGRSADNSNTLNTPADSQGQRSASEQEDHDMALALQLQEEEEEASRADATARRAREDELSRQFLDRENASRPPTSPTSDIPANRPAIPPRRSNLTGAAADSASPGLDAPYVRSSESADDMPPSYEQAASDRPFRPPGTQPRRSSNRQGDALGALNAITAQQRAQGLAGNPSASSMSVNSFATTATQASGHPGMVHRRRSSVLGGQGAASSTRMRRSQSQTNPNVQPGQGVYGGGMPGVYPGNMGPAGTGGRVQDPGQEKCVVM